MKRTLKHLAFLIVTLSNSFGSAATATEEYFELGSPLRYKAGKGILVEKAKFTGGLRKILQEKFPTFDLSNMEKYRKLEMVPDKDLSNDDFPKIPQPVSKGVSLDDVMKSASLQQTLMGYSLEAIKSPSSKLEKVAAAAQLPSFDALRLGYGYMINNMPKLALNTFVSLMNSLYIDTIQGFQTPCMHHDSIESSQLMLFAISGIMEVNPESLSANLMLIMFREVIRIGADKTGLGPDAFLYKIQHKL